MTQPPAWVTEIPWAPVHPTATPDTEFTPLFTDQELKAIGQQLIEGITKQVILAVLGAIAPGVDWQTQLSTWADDINGINTTLKTIFGDLAHLDAKDALTTLETSINTTIGGLLTDAKNLFGQIRLNLLPLIPASHVINVNPELLWAATFDTSTSIQGIAGFAWDGTVDHTGTAGSGSAKCTANGTLEQMMSHSIPVIATETVNISVWLQWTGVTYSASSPPPIHVDVYPYAAGVAQTPVMIGSITAPASSSGWIQLSGVYVVPSTVDSINVMMSVDTTCTAGSIWFDDASVQKPGLLAAGQTLTDHSEAVLTHLFGSNTLATNLQYPLLPNITIGAVGNDIKSHIQGFVDAVANALGHTGTAHSVANVQTFLGAIPTVNLTNVLGGTNLGADIQTLATNLFGSPIAGTAVQYSAIPQVTVGGVANDIESSFQGIVDNIAASIGSGTGQAISALQGFIENLPGDNIQISTAGGSGSANTAHQTLWDAIANGLLGLSTGGGTGAGVADVQSGMANLVTTINTLATTDVTTTYTAAGTYTYTPPSWATKLDVVVLGGGGGGAYGGFFDYGNGGAPGSFNGTYNITGFSSSISVTVGAGGTAVTAGIGGTAGGTGGTSSVNPAGTTYSGSGGAGGSGQTTSLTSNAGQAVNGGSAYVVNGKNYQGGLSTQTTGGGPSSNGNSPGGGGAGGNTVSGAYRSGAGASGAVWIRAHT